MRQRGIGSGQWLNGTGWPNRATPAGAVLLAMRMAVSRRPATRIRPPCHVSTSAWRPRHHAVQTGQNHRSARQNRHRSPGVSFPQRGSRGEQESDPYGALKHHLEAATVDGAAGTFSGSTRAARYAARSGRNWKSSVHLIVRPQLKGLVDTARIINEFGPPLKVRIAPPLPDLLTRFRRANQRFRNDQTCPCSGLSGSTALIPAVDFHPELSRFFHREVSHL